MDWECAKRLESLLSGPAGMLSEEKPKWQIRPRRFGKIDVKLEEHPRGDGWSLPEPTCLEDATANDWYLQILPPADCEEARELRITQNAHGGFELFELLPVARASDSPLEQAASVAGHILSMTGKMSVLSA